MDMGWTRNQEQLEKAELMKCDKMRRAYGLILDDEIDCTFCEIFNKCNYR